jgi:hypothetical protein
LSQNKTKNTNVYSIFIHNCLPPNESTPDVLQEVSKQNGFGAKRNEAPSLKKTPRNIKSYCFVGIKMSEKATHGVFTTL